jgi:tRNA-dihydrouridine synthase A
MARRGDGRKRRRSWRGRKSSGCWDGLDLCVVAAAAMAILAAGGGGFAVSGGRRGGIRLLCESLSIRTIHAARLSPRIYSSLFKGVGASYLAATTRPRGVRSSSSQSALPLHSVAPEVESSWRGSLDDGGGTARAGPHQRRLEEISKASRLTLAPMMDYTDRHFRHLVRLVSSRTLLYTEMVSANAVAHESRRRRNPQGRPSDDNSDNPSRYSNDDDDDDKNDPLYLARFLAQSPREGPSILQLGGSDPQLLFEASRTAAEMSRLSYRDLDPSIADDSAHADVKVCDYTGLNLNCGCPSPKVAGKGCFGAALMDDPALVRDLARAMHEGSDGQVPVSVKCRIGTDIMSFDRSSTHQRYAYGEDEYQKLCRFIETVAQDGIVTDFGVHARIAVLGRSFSPADNRKIPPLRYVVVRRLVRDYPTLRFTINGGFSSIEHIQIQMEECPNLAGVMVGRAWAADPWSFAMADAILYRDDDDQHLSDGRNRWQILEQFGAYADGEEQIWGAGRIRRFLLRAVSSLFAGEPNAKKYRIALDEIASQTKRLQQEQRASQLKDIPLSERLLEAAQKHLSQETLLRTPRESYEMRLWNDRESTTLVTSSGTTLSNNIAEWQQERKGGESSYNQTLQRGLVAEA